jgi:cytochrome c
MIPDLKNLPVLWLSVVLILLTFTACLKTRKGNEMDRLTQNKWQLYYLKGKEQYKQNCSNCHQIGGEGLGKLYPPIKNSDYLAKNKDLLPCIIRQGQNGEIIVNGISYNLEMPANPNLTNLEIAEITTYVFSEFLNKDTLVDVNMITELLTDCNMEQGESKFQ